MAQRYAKTETGRAEIQARIHALSRHARNLLLIIDGTKDAGSWVSVVNGASESDLQTLLDAGLITVIDTGSRAPDSAPAPTLSDDPPADGLGYEALYERLTALVKEQLGLLKGYKHTLAVERASGLAELRRVAIEVVGDIERAKGPVTAREARRLLGLPAA